MQMGPESALLRRFSTELTWRLFHLQRMMDNEVVPFVCSR